MQSYYAYQQWDQYIRRIKSFKVLNNRNIFRRRQAFTMTNKMVSWGLRKMLYLAILYLPQMMSFTVRWVIPGAKAVAPNLWCRPTWLPNDVMCSHNVWAPLQTFAPLVLYSGPGTVGPWWCWRAYLSVDVWRVKTKTSFTIRPVVYT